MKKILLTLTVFAAGFMAHSQVVCSGVSPAATQGNYTFEWADPGGGDWSCPDFLVSGTFVEDTLMWSEDSGQGLNPQGNPVSQEGCNPPQIANLAGKIALIYRNTCEFGAKALAAENAGAVAVIIINRDNEVVGMGGGADGLTVTIPVVMLSSVDGAALAAEMSNGPVVMLLGNKVGAYPNDVGANDGEMLISPYAGANDLQYDGFTPGIQIYNYGSADQSAITINAKIDGPNGNVYDETISPTLTMSEGDTLSIFPGNTDEFIAWNLGVGNYDNGLYTLTYTLDMGTPDDSDFDNILSSTFSITDGVNTPTLGNGILALSNVDGGGMPVSTTSPSNSTTEYQSCIMVQEPNASVMAVAGLYFIPHTDTSVNDLAGAEIFANAYQWDDAWVDLDDPAYQFDPATNDAFQNLNLITFGTHYPASNDDVDDVAYIEFTTPFGLVDNQRYLFCLQTFESATISFGYDGALNFDGNEGIFRQPTAPVHVDGQWYTGGWSGISSPSTALHTFDPASIGLGEVDMVEGSAFPNPAADKVTISIDANGDATLEVVDLAGKVAMNNTISLVNGAADVDMSSLESGVYIFNVTLENGQTSQFNVVKN
ncbi:MAG: T9SS type A sorting domain-containing protein [Crocinitomicaceae bacterium]|nr:T9SS type A sorting domain-containing protein [Crocinitomicaceae bacterium]